jgi:hypothetical protein
MLKLRTIGIRDYRVLEGRQRIGRIRFAEERMPGIWIWNIIVHIPAPPIGTAPTWKRPRYGSSGLG